MPPPVAPLPQTTIDELPRLHAGEYRYSSGMPALETSKSR